MRALDIVARRSKRSGVQLNPGPQHFQPTERADVHQRVLCLLRRFGYTANSFQILQSQFAYWFSGDDACVAYVDTGRAWVAAGAPIAAAHRLHPVALEFMAEGKSLGRRVAFFGTESRFLAGNQLRSLMVGRQPSFRTGDWSVRVDATRSLRQQLRRARGKGVRVERLSLTSSDGNSLAQSRRAIESLVDRWLATKRLPPLGFLTNVQPFSFAHERRYFLARDDTGLVGAAVMVPIFARRGWLLENLIRVPGAPNGTTEALIDAAVRDAGEAGDDFVTLGLTPLSGEIATCLRAAKQASCWLYDFRGLERFRAKLQPSAWSPVFVAFGNAHTAPLAIYDSLVAFAHGNLLQFGMQTVARCMTHATRALRADCNGRTSGTDGAVAVVNAIQP